jgi:hypothetical protein
MRDAGLAVELLETRHVRNAFKAMPVKTDAIALDRHSAHSAITENAVVQSNAPRKRGRSALKQLLAACA